LLRDDASGGSVGGPVGSHSRALFSWIMTRKGAAPFESRSVRVPPSGLLSCSQRLDRHGRQRSRLVAAFALSGLSAAAGGGSSAAAPASSRRLAEVRG